MLSRISPLLLRARPASSARAFASTYDFDRLYDTNHLDLPRLPIPSLDATLDAYITSLAPLVEDAADLARHTEAVEAFRVGEGPALDAELKRRDAAAAAEGGYPHFYFEKTWDEGYLGLSCSNVINVSPSLHLVAAPDGDTNQASRAARFVSATARWLTKARAGELVSDGLCMSQLGRLLGTARIPKINCDELTFHASASRHIVVQCANEFYAVDVFTENDTPVGPEALQVAFEGILKGVNAPGPNDVGVGALTALERPEWAAARDMLISVGPTTNKEALDTIDSAILLVALDHHRPADMLERGKSILHGVDTTRSNRWWDKHQLIVDSDGNASLQFEHSFSDGASWNRWLGEVWMAMHGEDEDMSKWPYGDLPPADASCTAVEASPITFELDSTLDVEIRRADTYLQESLGDALSTDVLYFDGFGKGAIKSWSLSPDATVQMAFQLAYQRRHNKPAPTYEACSTRQYFHGRTETIRSCSPEANAWVRSVLDDQSHEEQREALAAATKAQGGLARSAAGGMGVDRHLLGLSVLASEGGMTESDEAGKLFKDPIFSHSSTWALSTSNVSSPWLDLFGFGAVCSHGYGLGYMITDDNIPIHITSWKENADTSTQGMKGEIVAALEHIQTIMGGEQ